ncbi:MAG: hypothetical protein CL744_11755 [Chloroflexi bacterium]|nr:hypothetical protein [Chloroflexota bacterium]
MANYHLSTQTDYDKYARDGSNRSGVFLYHPQPNHKRENDYDDNQARQKTPGHGGGPLRPSTCGKSQHFSKWRYRRIFGSTGGQKNRKKYSNLWLTQTDGGEPLQFTHGDQSDTGPVWSHDSERIAFRSDRAGDDQSQIFVVPVHGGEARPVTEMKGDFGRME